MFQQEAIILIARTKKSGTPWAAASIILEEKALLPCAGLPPFEDEGLPSRRPSQGKGAFSVWENSMSSDEYKRLNNVNLDIDKFPKLVEKSNKRGQSLADAAGYYIEQGMQAEDDSEKPGKQPTAEQRFIKGKWHFRKVRNKYSSLKDAAESFLLEPTDENSEVLSQMCEDAGYDQAELLNRVKAKGWTGRNPFNSIVLQTSNGTPFGACVRWLTTKLESNKPVAVSDIFSEAFTLGWSEDTVKRARRRLENTVKGAEVNSYKIGKGWFWVLETSESLENEEGCGKRGGA